MKDIKTLEKMSTKELLKLWRTSSNELEVLRAGSIIQKRKGSDYPVGLASMLTGR